MNEFSQPIHSKGLNTAVENVHALHSGRKWQKAKWFQKAATAIVSTAMLVTADEGF